MDRTEINRNAQSCLETSVGSRDEAVQVILQWDA